MKSGDCDFEIIHFGWAGSLSFNPQVKQAKSNMITCTQSIKERLKKRPSHRCIEIEIVSKGVHTKSPKKCPFFSHAIFFTIVDLNFEEIDDATHFSATTLNQNEQPEETFRFDKNTTDQAKWTQVTDFKTINIEAKNYFPKKVLGEIRGSCHDMLLFLSFQRRIQKYHSTFIMNAGILNFLATVSNITRPDFNFFQ